MSTVLAILLALQDEKAAADALRAFEMEWAKCSQDAAGRRRAITPLKIHRTEKILDSLIKKVGTERETEVREELVRTLSLYIDNPKAADFLYDQLDKNLKWSAVMTALFEGLGRALPKLTRPKVEKVNAYVKHPNLTYARDSIRALGLIRHKSSLPALIERLRKCQQDMREYIRSAKLKNCDGG